MGDDATQVRKFAEELTRVQRSLYVYICTLVGSPADAEDVLQEANCRIWEQYEQFRPGSNLAAWAYKIAYFEVLTFRKRAQRRSQLFQEATMELLADRLTEKSDEFESRHQALRDCMRRLNPADRELIQRRYIEGVDIAELADRLGRQANSLYRSLARIRSLLLDCIQSRLGVEGNS